MKFLKDIASRILRKPQPINHQALSSDHYLDLPDAPDYISLPPSIPLAANIKLCEEMLPVWNKDRMKKSEHYTQWVEPFYL